MWVYGAPEAKYGALQIASFELEPPPPGHVPGEPLGEGGMLVPLYPLAGTLHHAGIAKLVGQAWHDYVPEPLENELPEAYSRAHDLWPLDRALRTLHRPSSPPELEAARRTWIHRELFHLQTAILRRPTALREAGRATQKLPLGLRDHFVERLPFPLTPDQKTVLGEILADLESDRPMARLLQGDVGSGKTLVAFLSALPSSRPAASAPLLAPTELLALQHAENAAKLLEPLGVRIAFLSGNLKAAGRGKLLEELAAGRLDFVVGTHALFSEDVTFKKLRYAVIDEQHRFGVVQRQAMTRKGDHPDLLLMSATPIPRTLALTAFGDLKTSAIRTMPAGRRPIVTHTNKMSNQQKVYDFVRRELETGRQAYFVYPLIEASEALDLKDAATMAEHLAETFEDFQWGSSTRVSTTSRRKRPWRSSGPARSRCSWPPAWSKWASTWPTPPVWS